jgi:hypothetical protein
MSGQSQFTVEDVWAAFEENWVFRIYAGKRPGYLRVDKRDPKWLDELLRWIWSSYIRTAIFITLLVWLVGAAGALLSGALDIFLTTLPGYLNAFGILLALVAFGWFIEKLSDVLVRLASAVDVDQEGFNAIVELWADHVASNIPLMLLFSFPFAVSNFVEARAIWTASLPPAQLAPWVVDPASSYFYGYYLFLHAIVVPFILGSGAAGLYGVVRLLKDLLQQPVKLASHNDLGVVIEFTAWLIMWVLIALASILLFGRSIVINRVDIPVSDLSGIGQAIIATLFILALGSFPIRWVHGAISRAKRVEANYWLDHKHRTLEQLKAHFEVSLEQSGGGGSAWQEELALLSARLEAIGARIQDVESIPTVPIRWPSIARVSLGSILALAAPLFQDWLLGQFPLP